MMYLDDTLTTDELSEASQEQRNTSAPAHNSYNLPFKAYASPATLRRGDMVAIYAGNDSPAYAVTVDDVVWWPAQPDSYTLVTTDGPFIVPRDSKLWVCAWSPLPV